MSQGIALPNDLAQNMNRKQQQAAALQNLRIQLAGEVYSNLVAVSYQAGLVTGIHAQQRESELYGSGAASGDEGDVGDHEHEKAGVHFGIDLLTPATTAVRAADTLMLMLGLIDPAMVQQGKDYQDQMLAVLRGQTSGAKRCAD